MESTAEGVRLVLVGSSTSLGAEVKRRLAERSLPVREAVLAEVGALDEDGGRRLAEYDGEAVLISAADDVEYEKFDLAILLGSAQETSPLLDRAATARICIDLSGASRRRDTVPWLHLGAQPGNAVPSSGLVAGPQPAAATLTSLLSPLAGALTCASATVLLPVSALGDGAADELHQQSLGLMNFTSFPKDRLARQLAFNVLPFEDPSRPGSASLSDDLGWEVQRVLGPGAPPCDLQLLLAPTFHGYGFSVRLTVAPGLMMQHLSERLTEAGVAVSLTGDAPASPVELQNEKRILVSRVRSAGEGVFWLWAVADSLGSGAAENAVRIAERMAWTRTPHGGGKG